MITTCYKGEVVLLCLLFLVKSELNVHGTPLTLYQVKATEGTDVDDIVDTCRVKSYMKIYVNI